MSWLLRALLIGAGIALVGVAVIGTGGLAAVAIVGGMAATGAGIGELMSQMSFAPKEVVGKIIKGSRNVFIRGRPAACAHVDLADCGKHPGPPKVIATGSGNVYINGMPAARIGDKTACSAEITKGAGNVFIGGGTQQTDAIEPENLVPPLVHAALFVAGMGAALVLGGPVLAIGGLVGGMAGGVGGNWLGGKVFGEGSDGQKWSMLGGSLVGGYLGIRGAPGAWSLAKRVEVEPGTLGVNGGNLRLRPVTAEASTDVGVEMPPPSSRLSPGGGLKAHEIAGGHLIDKHVGKTALDLKNRLAAEPNISGSSSFYSRTTAEDSVSSVLDANQAKVSDWLRGTAPRLRLDQPLANPVGISLTRGAAGAVEATSARVILVREPNMPTGYKILTGFPTLP